MPLEYYIDHNKLIFLSTCPLPLTNHIYSRLGQCHVMWEDCNIYNALITFQQILIVIWFDFFFLKWKINKYLLYFYSIILSLITTLPVINQYNKKLLRKKKKTPLVVLTCRDLLRQICSIYKWFSYNCLLRGMGEAWKNGLLR
jgi:hypothetical protein